MPFRFTNASTEFMNPMNRPMLGQSAIIFIDDILVYSKT